MLKKILPIIVCTVMLSSCSGKSEWKQSENKWTDVNEAMSHSHIQTTAPETQSDTVETSVTEAPPIQTQKNPDMSVMTNLQTSVPQTDTQSQPSQQTSLFTALPPENVLTYAIPQSWYQTASGNDVVIESGSGDVIALNVFQINADGIDEGSVYNEFINVLASSYLIGQPQSYGNWTVTAMQTDNASFLLYTIVSQRMIVSVMITQQTEKTIADEFLNSIFLK